MRHPFAKILMLLPFLALYKEDCLSAMWCSVLAGVTFLFCLGDDNSRQQRTPYYAIYIRLTMFLLAFMLGIEWIIQLSLHKAFIGYWGAVLAGYASSFCIVAYSVLFHGGVEWAVMSDDPAYQSLKRRGFSFFFDNLPETLNPDNDLERETGVKEPQYTNFVPPRSWLYQCPRCGARVEKQIDVCWRCNYGADGDSTDYVRRWGNPSTLPTQRQGPFAPMPLEDET